MDEVSDERFEKIADLMIHAYASLIRKGFPEEETARWENRLSKLPPTAQETIRDVVEIAEPLKDALADRFHQRDKANYERFLSR